MHRHPQLLRELRGRALSQAIDVKLYSQFITRNEMDRRAKTSDLGHTTNTVSYMVDDHNNGE